MFWEYDVFAKGYEIGFALGQNQYLEKFLRYGANNSDAPKYSALAKAFEMSKADIVEYAKALGVYNRDLDS